MCGCSKGSAGANGTTFKVVLNDGTTLPTAFADETSARVALARSGQGGRVQPQPK